MIRSFLFLCFYLLPLGLLAQHPLVRNYTGTEIKSAGRIWSVCQATDGTILAGSDEGLITYDGTSWAKISAPGRMLRELRLASDSTIYYGTANDFGRLIRRESGIYTFESFKTLLPEDFSMRTVFAIVEAHGSIYFETQQFVLRFTPETDRLSVIQSPTFIENLTVFNGNLIASSELGLIHIHPDNSLSVFPPSKPENSGLFGFFQTPTGKVIGLDRGSTFIQITDLKTGEHQPWATVSEQTKNIEFNVNNYSTNALTPFFGTAVVILHSWSDGLFVLREDGEILLKANTTTGLISNRVQNSMVDRDGNIWVATPKGLSKIMLGLPVRVYDETESVTTPVRSIGMIANDLYVGTDGGLLIRKKGDSEFSRYPAPYSQIWQMESWRDGLLVAGGNYGTWFISNRGFVDFKTPVATMSVKAASEGLVFAGLYNGFAAITFEDNTFKNAVYFEDISADCRSIVIDRDSTVWVGTRFDGIFSFHLPAFLQSPGKTPRVTWYRKEAGLAQIEHNHVTLYDDTLYVTDPSKIYFRSAVTNHFEPADLPFPKTAFPTLKSTANKKLWYLNNGTSLSNGTIDSLILRAVQGSINDVFEQGDSLWIATSTGLFLVSNDAKLNPVVLPLHIRSISGGSKAIANFGNPQISKDPIRFSWDERDVTFYFSTPYFVLEELTSYRYRLKGLDEQWQKAPLKNHIRYSSLAAGSYEFQVMATHSLGFSSPVVSASIVISAPWYAHGLAIVFYVLAITFFGVWIFRAYNFRLLKRNRFLEQAVEQRTQEIEKKNISLENTAEELRQANELKSRFINMAIHDMRNPLGALSGFNDLIRDQVSEKKEALALVERVDALIRQMLGRIADLLETHKTGNGIHVFSIEPIVQEILQSNSVLAEKKHQILDANLHVSAELEARPGDIRDAYDNLINNAIKFSPSGARILVELERVSSGPSEISWIRFAVHDEGPGIKLSDHEFIFKPYTTLSAKPTAGETSSGLGLSIVKDIVERYGGRVWFNSNPALRRGTTFYIDIPEYNKPV